MTVLASDIITRVSAAAADTSNVRWPSAEIINWINDAIREIAALHPDSCAQIGNVNLVSGTKQSMPAGTVALIRVTRNMGVGGNTPGEAPREADRELLDRVMPTWQAATATLVVKNFMRDLRTPRTFYVYPPMSGTTIVECEYSALPTPIVLTTDPLPLPDHYANPIVDYCLWRCFSKDIEIPGLLSKSQTRRQAFDEYLGAAEKAEESAQ